MKKVFYAISMCLVGQNQVEALHLNLFSPLQKTAEFIQTGSQIVGDLMNPSKSKYRVGGTRINAIEGNTSESCHKAQFKGGMKANQNVQNAGNKSEVDSKKYSPFSTMIAPMVPMSPAEVGVKGKAI